VISRADSLVVAERLTRALASGDVDALASLYAPDALIWHSTDQVELKLKEVLQLVHAIRTIAKCGVDVSSTLVTEQGFVQTQKNTYIFHDGSSTFFHAALVVTLDSHGRIVRVEEYLDSAGLAPLLAALNA
jgi:ketosteroid isomerase-like protein